MGSTCSIKQSQLQSCSSIEDDIVGVEGDLQKFIQPQIQDRSSYCFDDFKNVQLISIYSNPDSPLGDLVIKKQSNNKNFIQKGSQGLLFKTQISSMFREFDNKTKQLNRVYTQYKKTEDDEIKIITYKSIDIDYARQISEVADNDPQIDFSDRQRSQSAFNCFKGILKNGSYKQIRKKNFNNFLNQKEGFKIVRFQLPQIKGRRSLKQNQQIYQKRIGKGEKKERINLEAQQTQKSVKHSPSPSSCQKSSSILTSNKKSQKNNKPQRVQINTTFRQNL